jgi:hypothetical protein
MFDEISSIQAEYETCGFAAFSPSSKVDNCARYEGPEERPTISLIKFFDSVNLSRFSQALIPYAHQ